MDKKRFVEVAPYYYAIAICTYLTLKRNIADKSEIEHHFTFTDPEDDPFCLLQKEIIFDRAIEWLSSQGMIEVIADDFGPTAFVMKNNLKEKWDKLADAPGTPFYNHAIMRDSDNWLREALFKLNEKFDELQISDDDFQISDDEWQPLPLEKNSRELQEAIVALDNVVQQVRADNGYSVAQPEERDYVINTLSDATKTLRERDTTSIQYLRKFVVDPLQILIQRFKGAAIAIAATAARDTVIEFLKQYGVKLLEHLFR